MAQKMGPVSGEAHFLEEQMNSVRIKQYLDASRDYEKAKGMKWLLAMMSKGRDASEFFSDVVKNVVVKSVEVKKMVYMYLVHYADASHACREMALLSINSFQKDLAASNQLIRAMALRVMTSIRVADIVQIQLLAIKKCASDSSPYVRKCAANAISKMKEQSGELEELVEKLLNDSSTMVLGSAVIAFSEVCPENWGSLHQSYRKLCHLVADVDEWAQIVILETLARYIRSQFADPAPGASAAAKVLAARRSAAGKASMRKKVITRRTVKKAFYSDEEDESVEEEVEVQSSADGSEDAEQQTTSPAVVVISDPDHRLALRSTLPLLKSRNAGVVLAVCSLHYYCGDASDQIGRALVRILRNKREIQYVVLKSIATMATERPAMFRKYLKEFFVKETDAGFNRDLKLEILTALATTENATPILRELENYARSADTVFACAAVRAAGRVADARPDVAESVCSGLLALVAARGGGEDIVSTSIIAVRQLLQQGAGDRKDVVRRLARLLLKPIYSSKTRPVALRGPVARANVVWLVGEFRDCCDDILPDAVRLLASTFSDEAVEVKQQILNLAVKSSLDEEKCPESLLRYVLELARFDVNHDLRDRARYYAAVLGMAATPTADEHALSQLRARAPALTLSDKRPPLTLTGPVALDGLSDLLVGSLSIMVGHQVDGYLELPDWPDVPPDPSVRDAAVPPQHTALSADHSGVGPTDADVRDFYAAADDAYVQEDDEEDDEETEDDETSDDDDDDDDEDDDDDDDETSSEY
ncbi:hypothetical protein CTAYLR_001704, partial [Chrysophaeum taylorii]